MNYVTTIIFSHRRSIFSENALQGLAENLQRNPFCTIQDTPSRSRFLAKTSIVDHHDRYNNDFCDCDRVSGKRQTPLNSIKRRRGSGLSPKMIETDAMALA